MVKIIKGVLVVVILLMVAGSLWYYRPWSPYSPAGLVKFQDPKLAVENLRNFNKYFPDRPVKASTNPRLLETSASPLPETYAFNGETKRLSNFLADSTTTGLMIIKDGVIKHESYLRGANAESRFTSWSVAKSMVATMVFMALKEGKIGSLDDKAEDYASQYAGTDFGNTSLRGLLSMSSGIKFNEDYQADGSDIRNYFFGTFVLGQNSDSLLFDYSRNRAEGSDFTYISPNSHVLASVLRAIYKKPLADILTEKVWGPAGMESDAYWSQNIAGDEGMALGYCCMNARLADYARFGLFWLEALGGDGVGKTLLPDNAYDLVALPASEDHVAGQTQYPSRGYSHHFWLAEDAEGVFFANGVYGQMIWIDTRNNIIIARNGADQDFIARTPELVAVMKALSAHYGQ